MKKTTLLILIISLSILFVACGTKETEVPKQKLGDSEKILIEKQMKDLKFTVEMNKQNFDLDEEIMITATATNIGSTNFSYISGSSSCPTHLSVRIISKETGNLLMPKPADELKACTDDINVSYLEPNKTVQLQKVFLTEEMIDTTNVSALGGMYEVIVSIRPTDESLPDWMEPLEMKTEITIEGTGLPLVSRDEAEKIANNHPKVKQWILNHSGEVISKIENNEYYILWYDGWEKTVKEQYDILKNGIYQDEKQIRFEEGQWSVQYVSKIGPSPNRISIIIDSNSGEVLSVSTHNK